MKIIYTKALLNSPQGGKLVLVYTTKNDKRGRCIDPKKFSTPARGAKLVYTNSVKIREAYASLNIEVKKIKDK